MLTTIRTLMAIDWLKIFCLRNRPKDEDQAHPMLDILPQTLDSVKKSSSRFPRKMLAATISILEEEVTELVTELNNTTNLTAKKECPRITNAL
uniref:p120Pa n=2 Tax=Rice dwarf virus TaxID=10991 RepID=Q80B41_RDV|nr:P120Pa [Rice dwarf virus]